MAATNVRMNRSQGRTAKDMAKPATAARSSRTKASKAAPSPAELDDRIKHLECYIASASAANRTHRAMMADYVPAEESRRSTRSKSTRRPMHTMQLARRRSAALFMQVIVLVTMIAAAVGWMNQKFHFWN